MDRQEVFRQILIETMNKGLLNDFISIVFDYDLEANDFIYAQFKIVNNDITLNIFDNNKKNRFNGYVFIEESDNKDVCISKVKNIDATITYIYLDNCYNRYLNKRNLPNIIKLALSFRVNSLEGFNKIIKNTFPKNIEEIIYEEIKKAST